MIFSTKIKYAVVLFIIKSLQKAMAHIMAHVLLRFLLSPFFIFKIIKYTGTKLGYRTKNEAL